MKLAVFADIHGNVYALEAMLQQVRKYDVEGFVFCGDIMGYFMHQEEVIENLLQLPSLYAVKGNHDFYYINSLNDSKQRDIYVEKYGKSYLKDVPTAAKSYLENLPTAIELYCAGKKIMIVHGSLDQYMEGRIYPDTKIDENIYDKYDIVILGNTHYQMYRKLGKTILLNPGSLGQPRDFKGFSYCILNVETTECTFMKVDINQRALIDDLVDNNEEEHMIKYIRSKMEDIT